MYLGVSSANQKLFYETKNILQSDEISHPDMVDIYHDIYIGPQYRLFEAYHCVVVYQQGYIISVVLMFRAFSSQYGQTSNYEGIVTKPFHYINSCPALLRASLLVRPYDKYVIRSLFRH